MDNKVPDLPLSVSATAALAGMEVQRRRMRKAAAKLLRTWRKEVADRENTKPDAWDSELSEPIVASGYRLAIISFRAWCREYL
jgi:hypothetical protein